MYSLDFLISNLRSFLCNFILLVSTFCFWFLINYQTFILKKWKNTWIYKNVACIKKSKKKKKKLQSSKVTLGWYLFYKRKQFPLGICIPWTFILFHYTNYNLFLEKNPLQKPRREHGIQQETTLPNLSNSLKILLNTFLFRKVLIIL